MIIPENSIANSNENGYSIIIAAFRSGFAMSIFTKDTIMEIN